jgi:hypothetical protein
LNIFQDPSEDGEQSGVSLSPPAAQAQQVATSSSLPKVEDELVDLDGLHRWLRLPQQGLA